MCKIKKYYILVILLFLACSFPKEPQLPEWEISLTRIPLMAADTLILGEEFPDSNFIIDKDDLFHIFFKGENKIDISEQLRLESIQPEPINGEIGAFKINGNQGQRVHFNIFEAFPELQVFNGTRVSVPPIQCNLKKSVQMENFRNVSLQSGTVYVKVINNLAFPLCKPVRVALYDHVLKDTISVMVFNNFIPAFGGDQQASLSLAGKTLSNNIEVLITGTIAGTGSESVDIFENQGFDVEISMENLIAVAAEAKIPSQSYLVTTELDMSTDSLTINSANVSQGDITFFVQSNFYLPVQIKLSFPGILDQNFQSVNRVFNVLSQSSEKVVIDLANTTVNMKNGKLDLEITTTLLPQSDDFIKIQAGDKFIASARVSELRFSKLTGSIDLLTPFPKFEEEIVKTKFDLPKFNLHEVVLSLDFYNNPADMFINLDLNGESGSQENATAHYSFPIKNNTQSHIEITNKGVSVNGVPEGTGDGLIDVINLMPERIAFSGSARLQDDYATLKNTPIDINYSVDVPMIFSLPENTLLEGDTTNLDFKEAEKEKIKNLQNVNLEFTIANGLPIGGTLEIRVADSVICHSQPVRDWPLTTVSHFNSASCDKEGNIVEMKDETLSIEMNAEQIKLLIESDFLIWTVNLDPVEKARLKCTDKIILKQSYLTGTMKINENMFNNGNE